MMDSRRMLEIVAQSPDAPYEIAMAIMAEAQERAAQIAEAMGHLDVATAIRQDVVPE